MSRNYFRSPVRISDRRPAPARPIFLVEREVQALKDEFLGMQDLTTRDLAITAEWFDEEGAQELNDIAVKEDPSGYFLPIRRTEVILSEMVARRLASISCETASLYSARSLANVVCSKKSFGYLNRVANQRKCSFCF